MNDTHQHTDPQLVYTLTVPAHWLIDHDGVKEGLLIASDPSPWNAGFHPNVTMTQAPLGAEDEPSAETVLAQQQAVERTLDGHLRDYRLLHLDYEGFGLLCDGETPAPGVMRSAYYTAEDGTPLIMHQWAARHAGYEVTMTVTFPVADLPQWGIASWDIAGSLTWKEVAA